MQAGEQITATAVREAKEETDLNVRNSCVCPPFRNLPMLPTTILLVEGHFRSGRQRRRRDSAMGCE